MAVVPPLSESPTRLRLSSPAEILAAVPYLLGFAPQRSLVVLCLHGKQIGLTMRIDLDLPPVELREVVLARLAADGATTAVLIVFDPDPSSGSRRAGAALARSLIRAVRRAGFVVRDALGVRDGYFWSYLCHEARCCPPEGRPLPLPGGADHSRVAAPFVAIGAAPLGSRDELCASLATVTGERRAALEPCFEQALRSPSAHPIERWLAVVARYTEGPPRPHGTLQPTEAARLIVSLRDLRVRDEVLAWTAGSAITGVLAVLRELAPLALPPFDAQLLATLAWTAYSSGDGALAIVALQQALTADADHALALLLMQALDTGVTPVHLRAIGRELVGVFSGSGGLRSPDAR